MQVIIKLRKMRADAKRVLVLSRRCFERRTCLDRETRQSACVETVLSVCIGFEIGNGVIT